MTRRQAGRAAALTALSYSRILGANDRIGLGIIGVGGRGSYVGNLFTKNADVQLVAICDIWSKRLADAEAKGLAAKTYTDHQELLAAPSIDAVLVASPDHWHKDHAVDAMTAGKDVYVEKPTCRTRDEAPQMLRAARVHNRVCQVGLQQRSGEVYLESRDKFLLSGALGHVAHVDALWSSGVPRALPSEPAEKPADLDWVRFLGRVPYRDWSPAQYLNFRAFLDFNGGRMTDLGHHWIDVTHMFLGERAPDSVVFAGGIFYDRRDGRTAPDTCNALLEYKDHTVLFQSNAASTSGVEGVTFRGEKGVLYVDRGRYVFTPAGRNPQPVSRSIPGDITAAHVRNFLDCCRSRRRPNADIALAAVSILGPLLAIQSYEEKRRIHFDPDRLEPYPA